MAESTFQIAWPGGEPLVRFDYVRDCSWAPAHIQMHAESSMLGYLMALVGERKPPKTQLLHLPVGGQRFRPSLEDVIEFATRDLHVDALDGCQDRIDIGRARWRDRQTLAAVRDVVRHDPEKGPDRLRAAIGRAAATFDGLGEI